MALSPTSSRGTTFNGGTITTALTVDPAAFPANSRVLDLKCDAAPDAEVTASFSASMTEIDIAADGNGGAKLALADDNLDGGVALATASASFVSPRSSALSSADAFYVGQASGPKFAVKPAGWFSTSAHSAPAASDLATGEMAVWFDQTNGAAALRILSKQADATVKSGSVTVALPTSGALPTVALVSATGSQVSTTRDVETVTPFTGDGTNNVASCQVQLSPDGSTYSTLDTLSVAAALNLTGVLTLAASVRVPAGWYLKLTAVHGSLGTTTYY